MRIQKLTFLVFLLSLMTVVAKGYKIKDGNVTVDDVDDFVRCANENPRLANKCLDSLEIFLKKNPGKNLDAAKKVRRTMNHYVAAPLFKRALEGAQNSEEICIDDDLIMSVNAGLARPVEKVEAQAAFSVAEGKCWEVFKDQLKVEAKAGSELKSAACRIYAKKGQKLPECF